jgi:O-antigen/teichoic acid export membrane protein
MENLSERVSRSGLWMVALNVTGRLLGMVRLLILARLLTPYDFGLVGIALVVISLFESFSATGTHLALIQRKEPARDLFDTAWTRGSIRGRHGASWCSLPPWACSSARRTPWPSSG